MTNSQTTEQTSRGRRQFLLMALFFFGPLAVAFVIYYGFDWRPAGSTEHGELVLPPVVLSDVALGEPRGDETPQFRRKWSLIMIEDNGCPDTCQAMLYETRQVRTALGRENTRVQRVLMITGDHDAETITMQHPDVVIVDAAGEAGETLQPSIAPLAREYVYLVDPIGNLMMRFPRDTSMRDIHTDLKKLLKLSSIG